jgi:hypothetical protein
MTRELFPDENNTFADGRLNLSVYNQRRTIQSEFRGLHVARKVLSTVSRITNEIFALKIHFFQTEKW